MVAYISCYLTPEVSGSATVLGPLKPIRASGQEGIGLLLGVMCSLLASGQGWDQSPPEGPLLNRILDSARYWLSKLFRAPGQGGDRGGDWGSFGKSEISQICQNCHGPCTPPGYPTAWPWPPPCHTTTVADRGVGKGAMPPACKK